jgi:hypothetical protein
MAPSHLSLALHNALSASFGLVPGNNTAGLKQVFVPTQPSPSVLNTTASPGCRRRVRRSMVTLIVRERQSVRRLGDAPLPSPS